MVGDMDKTRIHRQQISELADGRLRGEAFVQAVEAAVSDDDARATWHAYHLVGDTLRSSDLARCDVKNHFMARLQARLKTEDASTASAMAMSVVAVELAARAQTGVQPRAQFDRTAEPANAAVYRWRMVAALASVAAVSVLGWSLLRGGADDATPALASVVPASAPPSLSAAPDQNPPAVMIRDANLDALLAAHKQFGGTSALQAPAGFLRNATFDGAGR